MTSLRPYAATIACAVFLTSWVAALLCAPVCLSAPAWPSIGDGLGQLACWILAACAGIAVAALSIDVAKGTGRRSQGTWSLTVTLLLLGTGTLGCLLSLGCDSIEYLWPTWPEMPGHEAFPMPSLWKLRGAAGMLAGAVGVLVFRVTSKPLTNV